MLAGGSSADAASPTRAEHDTAELRQQRTGISAASLSGLVWSEAVLTGVPR